uniref:Uncharacterized protein n=1 Tax=Vitis vinifera TaxID=29760 RepID=A5B3H0_VITVI|nr:hypothetical protein VITISV_000915 [Vitis vinifera]
MPPSEDGAPSSPLQRRYQTKKPPITPRASSSCPKKSISCPLAKKARVSGPVEPSEPPQPQPPTTESQIPSRMTPESMITHHVWDPTVIHFTIDVRHGILGARHIVEVLRIPYEIVSPTDYREWAHLSQSDMVLILSKGTSTRSFLLRKEIPPNMFLLDALLHFNIFPLQHMVQSRGAILEALFRISEGFDFGPYHLIMTVLLYFEEKPHLERRHICREIFTLNKWTNMTAYVAHPGAPVGPKVQRSMSYIVDIDRYSERPCPADGSRTCTLGSAYYYPNPAYCHFRQIQQHLGILSPPKHDMPGPSEPTDPSQDSPPVEQTVPYEKTTTGEIETPIPSTQTSTTEPSSPHDPPTTT